MFVSASKRCKMHVATVSAPSCSNGFRQIHAQCLSILFSYDEVLQFLRPCGHARVKSIVGKVCGICAREIASATLNCTTGRLDLLQSSCYAIQIFGDLQHCSPIFGRRLALRSYEGIRRFPHFGGGGSDAIGAQGVRPRPIDWLIETSRKKEQIDARRVQAAPSHGIDRESVGSALCATLASPRWPR